MDPRFIQWMGRCLPRFPNRRGFLWMALAAMPLLAGCSKGSPPTVSTAINTPSVTNPPASTTPAPVGADWPTYHRDNARSGYLPDMPDPQQLTVAWNTQVDGAVYAEPLVVSGHVIVATENNSLYSLNADT